MIRPIILSAALAFGAAAVLAGDPVVKFGYEDPEMKFAVSEAQETLDLFLNHSFDDSGRSLPGTMIKVGLEAPYGQENIWVENFSLRTNGWMNGQLANEPHDLPGLHYGDSVTFHREDLRDWGLFSGGTLFGNFTTRIMLPHLEEEERDRLKDALSPNPVPQSWQTE